MRYPIRHSFAHLALGLAASAAQADFTVTFDLDGRATADDPAMLSQTVPEGGDATAPAISVAPSWIFTGWDAPLTGISADQTITAQYASDIDRDGTADADDPDPDGLPDAATARQALDLYTGVDEAPGRRALPDQAILPAEAPDGEVRFRFFENEDPQGLQPIPEWSRDLGAADGWKRRGFQLDRSPVENGRRLVEARLGDRADEPRLFFRLRTANPPPEPTDDSATLTGNASAALDLLANDTDSGGAAALTITALDGDPDQLGQPLDLPGGTLTLGADGAATVAPDPALAAGEQRSTSLAYTVSDPFGRSSDGSLALTFTGVNDPPTASPPDGLAVNDGGLLFFNPANFGDDVDHGDVLRFNAAEGQSLTGADPAPVVLDTGGRLAPDGDGGLGFFPTKRFGQGESGSESFTYTLADNAGATVQATATVAVTGVNDPPVAEDLEPVLPFPGGGLAYRLQSVPTDITSVDGLDPQAPLTGHTVEIGGDVRRSEEHFGVVFSGFLDIDRADDYTFELTSKDGSRLRIDGQTVADNDGTHPAQTASGTIALAPGLHPVELRYFHTTGTPKLRLEYAPADELLVRAIDEKVTSVDAIPADARIEGSTSEPLAFALDRLGAGTTAKFAFIFSGFFAVETAGEHTFHLTSRDGSRLSLDGQTVVDNDGVHPARTETGSATLDVGRQAFELRYFNRTSVDPNDPASIDQVELSLEIETPDGQRRPLSDFAISSNRPLLAPDLLRERPGTTLDLLDRVDDPDVNDTLAVTEVAGDPAKVGQSLATPEGATLTVAADGSAIFETGGVFWPTHSGTPPADRRSDPIPDGFRVEDSAAASADMGLRFALASPWFFGGNPFRPLGTTGTLPNEPAFDGLPGGLSLQVPCSTPTYNRIVVTNALDRAVTVRLDTALFNSSTHVTSRRLDLAANSEITLRDYQFNSERFATYELIYQDRYDVAQASSNAVPSCYAPQMELRALGSTFETSHFELVNNNDVPVTYELRPDSGSVKTGTIAANSSPDFVFPYDARVSLFMNGLQVVSRTADVETLIPDFKDQITITPLCSDSTTATFEVENNSPEAIDLSVGTAGAEIAVAAMTTKEFTVPRETQITVDIKQADFDTIQPSTDSCNSVDVRIDEVQNVSGTIYVFIVNDESNLFDARLVNAAQTSTSISFELPANQSTFAPGVSAAFDSGDEIILEVELSPGSDDFIEVDRATIP